MKASKAVFLTFLISSLLIFFRISASGQDQNGMDVFLNHRCNKCHSMKALNIQKLPRKGGEGEENKDDELVEKPPDLSNVGLKRDAAWMLRWLEKKEEIEGKAHVKKFKGTQEEEEAVSRWLEAQKSTQYGDAK